MLGGSGTLAARDEAFLAAPARRRAEQAAEAARVLALRQSGVTAEAALRPLDWAAEHGTAVQMVPALLELPGVGNLGVQLAAG